VYHAIKLQYLDVALNAIASKDFTPIVDLSLRLAEIHLKDLLFGQVIVLKAPFQPNLKERGSLRTLVLSSFLDCVEPPRLSTKNAVAGDAFDALCPPSGLPFPDLSVPSRAQSVSNVTSSVPDGSQSAPNVGASELASSL